MDFEPDGLHNNSRSYLTIHEILVFDVKRRFFCFLTIRPIDALSYHFTLNDPRQVQSYSTQHGTYILIGLYVSASTANVFG